MKKRTKVILGVAAGLVLTLAGARAAHKSKWEHWVAAQEASFQQARLAARSANLSATPGVGADLQTGPLRVRPAAPLQTRQNMSQDTHAQHEGRAAASAAMSGQQHPHTEEHMRWSEPRPESAADLARADEIVTTLRASLDRYKDYTAAVEDGYIPFLPELDLPMYHFTNYRRSLAAAFRFDAAKPSSLLYRKHSTGYELIGVMYTAPRRFSEAQLDERVPLSVARWHQHVNICLPSGTPIERARADWARFGPNGSIASESACNEASGRWQPVLFGWMVHVYPFQQSREKIWTH